MTSALEASVEIDDLKAGLEEMRGQHAHNFDPAQFYFLESMLARANTSGMDIRRGLLHRTEIGLKRLAADFLSARSACAERLSQLETLRPDAAGTARSLFECGKLRAALREISRQQKPVPASRLPTAAASNHRSESAVGPAASLADAIAHQQQQLFPHVQADELLSTQRVRSQLLKQNAGSLIQQAQQQAPEDSGPLNPQRLALHSLVTMGELSPQYLQRFVSYIDTLSWLEEVGS
jgi:hypothetical protein